MYGHPTQHRPTAITEAGRRNWNRLVALAGSPATDVTAAKKMADSLAALVAEVTPAHREVLASQITTRGAIGRMRTWPIPPCVTGPQAARERWAALVFLDLVDQVSDSMARDHKLDERQGWRARAALYTQGAEHNQS